jgi:cysteine synthase A
VEYVNSMLEVIGNTRLLKLNKLGKNLPANVFVKLEHLNPSGSYKDRMALAMVEAAEKGLTWNGKKLRPGGIVCDASAGNTAPALAFVCAVKGYKARLCTYRTMLHAAEKSVRLKITEAFGPEIYQCPLPREDLLKECSNERERAYFFILSGKLHMYQLEISEPAAVWVDQIYNEYNMIGQMEMGREIYRQLDGKIDAWGCSLGSGGTLLGVALALREVSVKPWTFGVVPAEPGSEAPELDELKFTKKMVKLMGLKKWETEESIAERMYKMGYPNEMFRVTAEDARAMANRLCREEGIYCGMSSGANVYAALKVAERMKTGQNVVTVIVDRRDRYLDEYPEDIYVT